MKTVGLPGGMSWESTVGYYKAINEGVKNKLGGVYSAQIAMFSVDFEFLRIINELSQNEAEAVILGCTEISSWSNKLIRP